MRDVDLDRWRRRASWPRSVPRVDGDRRVVGDRVALFRRGPGRDRRLERRRRRSAGTRSPGLRLPRRSRRAGRSSRRCPDGPGEGRTEAGAGGGDEGAVAGATVEDQPVSEDQAFDQRFEFDRQRRDVDREALVVVAVPGDVGLEEDFVAGEFEAEAGRLAVYRDHVVDGHLGQRRSRRQPGSRARDGGDEAFADFRFGRAAPGRRFEGAQRAALGRAGVDAEADRQVDPDVFSSPTGVSPGGAWLTMNWVKPQFGWAAAASSKNWSSVSTEQSSALFRRFFGAGPGLPARVDLSGSADRWGR